MPIFEMKQLNDTGISKVIFAIDINTYSSLKKQVLYDNVCFKLELDKL